MILIKIFVKLAKNIVFDYEKAPLNLNVKLIKTLFLNIIYCQPVIYVVYSICNKTYKQILKLSSSILHWPKSYIQKYFLAEYYRSQ
ncbi:MAG: hypothetical protein EBT86_03425 [Actinobacteria bacterium]|nr:hypothetical protein [Actinomycetota bacterium]